MALNSQNTILRIGDGEVSETFTAIAEVKRINGLSLKADVADSSHLGSKWRRFIATIRDGGDVSFDLNFDPAEATHLALIQSLLDNDEGSNFELEFPDDAGSTWEFPAVVTAFNVNTSTADLISASCTLKVNGAPTAMEGITIPA